MAIGQRIKFFRKKQGMTQKQLGKLLGFLCKTSDVRVAQYESETRIPKQELVKKIAAIFHINPYALTVPEIDSDIGLIHTFFALEDIYGVKISKINGKLCLCFDSLDITHPSISPILQSWQQQAAMLENGTLSKKEYDQWRYQYPQQNSYKH